MRPLVARPDSLTRATRFARSPGIVRALLSRGWDDASIEQLEQLGRASKERGHSTHVYELDKAGHWLHAQNPQGLVDLMIDSQRLIHGDETHDD